MWQITNENHLLHAFYAVCLEEPKNDAIVWEYIEEGQQFSNNASLPLMEKLHRLVNRAVTT